jgi:hypothetical protein
MKARLMKILDWIQVDSIKHQPSVWIKQNMEVYCSKINQGLKIRKKQYV